MTLFEESAPRARRPRASRSARVGMIALAVALVSMALLSFLPAPYVVEQPGPVFNTLGEASTTDGGSQQLITVDGAETYPTAGTLTLLTVQVLGTRERTPSWLELAASWFDPSRAVVPLDSVFPADQTTEQRQEESSAMMVDSQQEATAAALGHLGYDIGASVSVVAVADDGAAAGILQADDVILAVDGSPVSDVTALRGAVNAGDGAPIALTVQRGGEQTTVTVAPRQAEADGETTWLLGVSVMASYEFPFTVDIRLDDVGGPSAGMMFALGIIDVLTPGELNGGQNVAGTGTISADGTVGAIGGIRQKMWGAVRSGATWFLAPAANCGEVVGHVPDGLRVFSVSTLDDALNVLDTITSDGDLDALPTCAAS